MNRRAQRAHKEIKAMKQAKATKHKTTAQTAAERPARTKVAVGKGKATQRGQAPKVGDVKGRGKAEESASNEAARASKKAQVIALLERKEGATLAQMVEATGWQKHTVRGFLSAALGKKLGLQIEATKEDGGERTYRVSK